MAGKKQKRQLRWSRERIRAELSRLDDITGLKGANVTVRLYEEREPLGLFTFIGPVRMTFGFSSPRFEDPKFTQAEALDVIRHEYAHYMEYALFGESTDHGPNWQNCCRRIGARPQTFYTSEWAELARGLEKPGLSAPGWTASHRVNRSLTPPLVWALWRRWNDIRL